MAVALDGRGVRLDEKHVPVATCGYEELERWSRDLGQVHAFGVEGTGSYGAGLARFLTCRGYTVIEVNRPDRSVRYRKGKSDPTDAEMAARSVLAGVADATPKSGEGEVEMIRMLKSAKNSAVMARTQAINQMNALVLTAPAELRETLDGLTTRALVRRCECFRPSRPGSPTTAAKYALRSLACRYRQLNTEIQDLKAELQRLIQATAPALVEAFGVGPDTAAALLITAGSNPDRLHSEAAFASLCGVSPVPDHPARQPASAQSWWRSPSQCGTVSHSCRQAALRSENTGLLASTNRRRNEQDRGHPLPQTLCRSRSLLDHPQAQPSTRKGRLTTIGASFFTTVRPQAPACTCCELNSDKLNRAARYHSGCLILECT